MKHSQKFRNFGEVISGCVLRNVAQIATEKEKVFRFGKRALSYVQKMGIVTWGGSLGTFRNVRRNRGSGSAELGCQPITLGDGKRGCAAVERKHQLVTAPPDFKLAIVLHIPRLIIFMSMNLCGRAVQWPAFGCRL